MREVSDALDHLEKDKDIGAVIITGSEKAFAAGKLDSESAYDKLLPHIYY